MTAHEWHSTCNAWCKGDVHCHVVDLGGAASLRVMMRNKHMVERDMGIEIERFAPCDDETPIEDMFHSSVLCFFRFPSEVTA